MPKLVREDLDKLNSLITITIGQEDYNTKFHEELKKLRDKASIKGFRKGKTPPSFLKKMYGKSLLSDIITQLLQEELTSYLSKDEFQYLGRPIAAESQKIIEFVVDGNEDYVFKFDIGLSPEFEIIGADETAEYEYFKVPVSDDKVNERLNYFRKRRGTRADTEELIQADDLVTLNASELDGEESKKDGWKTTFSVLMERVSDSNKSEFTTKKKGDTIRFNIFELEKNANKEYVKKYLLNFTETDIEQGTETGEYFEAIIESVGRMTPAEMDQKFFDETFGEGQVASEDEAKEKLREIIGQQDVADADGLLFRDIRTALLEKNRENMPLPDDFLKRWVQLSQEREAEKILGNYDKFADDLRWSLIKNKIAKQFSLEVKEEDIRELAMHRVASYFGGYYQMDAIQGVVDRLMQDADQVNSMASEVIGNKLFFALKEKVKLKEVNITSEELKAKIEELTAKQNAEAADEVIVE